MVDFYGIGSMPMASSWQLAQLDAMPMTPATPIFNFAPSAPVNGFNWGAPSSSGQRSEEEILIDEQYKKLKTIVEKLISNCADLSSEDKAKLEAAKNKTGKSEDKIEYLQDALEEISEEGKELVKEFILEESKDIKLNGKPISELVIKTGIGESDAITSDKLLAFKNAIENDQEESPALYTDLQNGTIDILELVSRYNSMETAGGLMPDLVANGKTGLIDVLVTKLIDRASSSDLRRHLSEETKTELDDAIEYLRSCTSYDSTKTAAFNELYQLTRMAAAADLDKRLQDEYGELLPEIFNGSTITSQTATDLDSEGFDVDTTLITTDSASGTTTTQTLEQQVQNLIDSDKLVQTDTMYTVKDANGQPLKDANGNDVQVRLYEEKYTTGDRDEKRVFYIYKGKMYELLGKTINDASSATNTDQIETTLSAISSARRSEFSDVELSLGIADINYGAIDGYCANKTKECEQYGAYDVAGSTLVGIKEQIKASIIKQLREQGYNTNTTEFNNLFETAYQDAKTFACGEHVQVRKGKSSWGAFWSEGRWTGYHTTSKVNIKELVDTFVNRIQENVLDLVKTKNINGEASEGGKTYEADSKTGFGKFLTRLGSCAGTGCTIGTGIGTCINPGLGSGIGALVGTVIGTGVGAVWGVGEAIYDWLS